VAKKEIKLNENTQNGLITNHITRIRNTMRHSATNYGHVHTIDS